MPPYFQASLLCHFCISKVPTKDDPNRKKFQAQTDIWISSARSVAVALPSLDFLDAMESTTSESFSELSKAATGVEASILRIYLRDVAWTVGIYLAIPLSTRLESFELEQGRDHVDLGEAMSTYRSATQCLFQPPSHLFDTAKKWIQHASRNEQSSVIDAYDTALQGLPQVAALSFDVQFQLEGISG